jgi:hypothetical protein
LTPFSEDVVLGEEKEEAEIIEETDTNIV